MSRAVASDSTVAIAIQHDFAYGSYCVSATGSDTWPRLVHDMQKRT